MKADFVFKKMIKFKTSVDGCFLYYNFIDTILNIILELYK